ncbi:MAG TPA: serine/threonine-protein kinase, partial [Kofleriaceae bacterium]|nr:serine/threonine-protein kinase [Kofleriaceae bacterium]
MAGHDGGDPSEGGQAARETDPFARTELVDSDERPHRDTDPFARTEIVGSSPPSAPDATTPVVVRSGSGSGGGAARDERAERLKKGGVVGRFTVIDVLGSGGMGVVLAAFDPSLDRRVAIKMLHEDVSEGHAARLEREARAMAQLSHPNVVTVHETGTFEGRLYIAMELIEGQTLGQWLKAGKRTRARILDVMLQAGRGLAAAHEAGLVHRDFKPDNVLVGKDGRVRVSDFGLVTAVGDDAAGEGVGGMATGSFAPKSALTMAGSIMGTPLYMAPEQHGGQPADAKADQFSFCVTLWQALSGEAPYAADSYKQLLENLEAGRLRALPRGVRLPSRLRAALTRGLSTA